ncbi:391_t:CDS:2 [Gigaspora rosea]|nr:391_t:CDS:2 [Gigaspora rosea]
MLKDMLNQLAIECGMKEDLMRKLQVVRILHGANRIQDHYIKDIVTPKKEGIKDVINEKEKKIVKLEWSQNNTTHKLGDCTLHEALSVISSNICVFLSKSKSIEDIKTNNFLDAKEVSDIMRKKNREEKLLRVMKLPLLKLKRHIIPLRQYNLSEIVESLDSKTVKNLCDQNQNKNQDKTTQLHKKKGAENVAQVIADRIKDNKLIDSNHVCEIPETSLYPNSYTVLSLDLVQLFDKATDAEYSAIKANQEETLC